MATYSISGTVLTRTNNSDGSISFNPVAVSIGFNGGQPNIGCVGSSAVDGSFTISGLPPGTYIITAGAGQIYAGETNPKTPILWSFQPVAAIGNSTQLLTSGAAECPATVTITTANQIQKFTAYPYAQSFNPGDNQPFGPYYKDPR